MYQCGTLPVFVETPRNPNLWSCLQIWELSEDAPSTEKGYSEDESGQNRRLEEDPPVVPVIEQHVVTLMHANVIPRARGAEMPEKYSWR